MFIGLIVPSGEFDSLYLELLEKAIKSGSRRKFTWINKKDIHDQVLSIEASRSDFHSISKLNLIALRKTSDQ